MSDSLPEPRQVAVLLQRRLGDCVVSIPMLRFLRRRLPGAEIAVLSPNELGRMVFSGSPDVNHNLLLPDWQEPLDDVAAQYDLALGTYDSEDARHFLSRIARSSHSLPSRPGANRATSRVAFAAGALGQAVPDDFDYRYLLYPSAQDERAAEKLLAPLAGKTLVACQLSCHGLKKRSGALRRFLPPPIHPRAWPLAHWCKLLKSYQHRTDIHFVLLGQDSEAAYADFVLERAGVDNALSLAGRLQGLQSLAAIARCRLLITPDTGVLHLGAAAGVPMLALFGADGRDAVAASPPAPMNRYQTLIAAKTRRIRPDEVAAAMDALLDSTPSGGRSGARHDGRADPIAAPGAGE